MEKLVHLKRPDFPKKYARLIGNLTNYLPHERIPVDKVNRMLRVLSKTDDESTIETYIKRLTNFHVNAGDAKSTDEESEKVFLEEVNLLSEKQA